MCFGSNREWGNTFTQMLMIDCDWEHCFKQHLWRQVFWNLDHISLASGLVYSDHGDVIQNREQRPLFGAIHTNNNRLCSLQCT